VFVERPLSAAVLVICVVLILLPMWLRRRKALVPAEAAPD